MTDTFYGLGERGDARRDTTLALATALQAIVALDSRLQQHSILTAWGRLEHEIAGAQAAAESGRAGADIQSILCARLGVMVLPRGHVALGDLDARARRWSAVRRREGDAALRALIAGLAPPRGSLDLVALATNTAAALGRVSSSSWRMTAGKGGRAFELVSGHGPDLADLMLAVPYALRRAGLTRQLLPAVSGRVRVFASEDLPPLAQLTRWAQTLAAQAGEGAARLRLLERYLASAEAQLISVRRPAALQRLVTVALGRWSVWAAQLARATRVDISSAWRTLEQAAELGIVQRVPGPVPSRGNGTLYAIPPWLRLAGLISAPRGRPTAPPRSQVSGIKPGPAGLASALDDVDAAIAAADRLLAVER